jgi:hypothetical protein
VIDLRGIEVEDLCHPNKSLKQELAGISIDSGEVLIKVMGPPSIEGSDWAFSVNQISGPGSGGHTGWLLGSYRFHIGSNQFVCNEYVIGGSCLEHHHPATVGQDIPEGSLALIHLYLIEIGVTKIEIR